MLSDTIIKRLVLARYFFNLASDNAKSHREVECFAAINVLQDALEIFLLAASEHLNAEIGKQTKFEQYIDKINERITPKELPFRAKLIQINKIRVASRHDGIKPDIDEIKKLILIAKEFFEEVSRIIFGIDFWTISLLELLKMGEAKNFLLDATAAFTKEDFRGCLINCRMAFYIEFEAIYDVKKFESDDTSEFGFFGWFSKAPFWAKNKQYIDDNVREPFDYIVFDHAAVDRELLKDGIDPQAFWNVWRLTPQVYRQDDDQWLVRDDLKKFDLEGIKGRAAYALENTIDIILKKHLKQRSALSIPLPSNYFVDLKKEGTNIYNKADRSIVSMAVTPVGLKQVAVDACVPGIKNDGNYWKVAHFDEQKGFHIFGYIFEDDVKDT